MDRSHRQDPMLFLVPVNGQSQSVEELEQSALDELAAVAEKHLSRLSGSSSPCLRFLATVREQADLASETVASPLRLVQ